MIVPVLAVLLATAQERHLIQRKEHTGYLWVLDVSLTNWRHSKDRLHQHLRTLNCRQKREAMMRKTLEAGCRRRQSDELAE